MSPRNCFAESTATQGRATNFPKREVGELRTPWRQIAIFCAAILAIAATPAAARVLVTNANGYTLDGGRLVRFAALLIGDDGRVVATYARGAATPRPAPKDIRLDAKGRTLLPGLIDAHGHVMGLGEQALSIDLSETASLADALAKVKAYAAANPNARWITGRGWNQERWGLGRFPTAAELDSAVADRPVWLARVDGHAGWANTRALAASGVTAATADPTGGRIERLPSGGPAGVFVDAAADLVDAKVPPPTEADRRAALTAALNIMASVGLTGAGDMGVDPATWARYRDFDAKRLLTARIAAYAGGMKSLAAIAPNGPIGWTADGRLSLPGVKLYADGALGSRGAWLKADYADAPGNRGLRFNTDAELRAMTAKADAQGFDLAVHAIGDAADAQVLDAFAALPKSARRRRVEHAQVLDTADLPRFAALGVTASMQPTHATSDKSMAEDRLGSARLAGAYAWRTLIASGAAFAGGSDFPVEPPNPFFGLHAAVTRQDRSGQPIGGWRVGEALTIEQAFAAFTTGAATANRSDAGALVAGKWGDFILVDRDPFAVPPSELWKIAVEQTWVGGKQVFGR